MKHSNSMTQFKKNSIILSVVLFLITGTTITSCSKNAAEIPADVLQTNNNAAASAESNGFGNYHDLTAETIAELQQAKIATARYNNFENALTDGYVDINVIVPEMGYHYLKVSNLDAVFEYAKPEILVYNKEENGRMKLVAVEYAVPISLSATPPAGFTGDNDIWSVYQGTLWTLHAWVWEYNQLGVFNPTNPSIHIH